MGINCWRRSRVGVGGKGLSVEIGKVERSMASINVLAIRRKVSGDGDPELGGEAGVISLSGSRPWTLTLSLQTESRHRVTIWWEPGIMKETVNRRFIVIGGNIRTHELVRIIPW